MLSMCSCISSQNLVRELETKSLTMESALATKQHSLGALQKHCDDAKRYVDVLFCVIIVCVDLFESGGYSVS